MVSRSTRIVSQLVLVILAMVISTTALAQVTARVDRARLVEGETLTLVLQTNDSRQTLDTDLTGLEGNFLVLDQRSETQMSIVNGQQSAVIRKMITLEPVRAGQLTIPALSVGNVVTQPISIQVDEAPPLDPNAPEPVFIEIALNPEEGPFYVHSQIGFTVRLFYQQSLTEAAISQPEPENASVRLLDEVPFQADRGGHRYRVLERHYAIFPERSGSMVIPPVVLSGRLVDRGSDRLWQPSRRGRRISVESEPITVEVSPRPASFSGDTWQPARSYRLGEELSTSGEIRVGEPVTRTVIIDAVGLEENMISEPEWAEIPDARIYPDQPQGISRDDGQWVLGHKEFRYAVVPETEGVLTLPELRVVWWDTQADEERVSILPARDVTVLPSQSAVASTPLTDTGAVGFEPGPGLVEGSGVGGYWRWLTMIFAALWLATLAFALRSPRGPRMTKPAAVETDEAEVLAQFKRACSSGDAGAARAALRTWLRRFAPLSVATRSSLVDFASQCGHDSLAQALHEMDASGFSRDHGKTWEGKTLYKAFEEWRKNAFSKKKAEQASIIDLYSEDKRRKAG